MLPLLEEEAKERQRMGQQIIADPTEVGQARNHAAAALTVSPRYVSDAKKLKADANLLPIITLTILS